MKTIFDHTRLGTLEVRNRLVRSATWEALADGKGNIPEELYAIYDSLAEGGVGTVIQGFTSVDAEDRYFGGMMRLSDDSLIPQYRKLTERVHERRAKILVQLALGGYYRDGRELEPNDMTPEDITRVKRLFVDAAIRAEKAGYDGVQVHVAHFFFLSRFVSPAVNQRSDRFGGNNGNRAALVEDIIRGIKAQTKLHVSAKVNSSDFTPGGLDEQQAMDMALRYCAAGLDSIEVSGNGTSLSGVGPHKGEGYFADFATVLAERTDVPVIVVGGFRTVDTMNRILDKTKVQFIAISRPLVREPDLPKLWAKDNAYLPKCVSCNACYRTPGHRCIFNLRAGRK